MIKLENNENFNKILSNIIIPESLFVDSGNISGKNILDKFKNKAKINLLQLLQDTDLFPLNNKNQCVIFNKFKKECIGNSVGSHSISSTQNLKTIANEVQKKVYKLDGNKSFYSQFNNNGQYFSEIPISKASVFPGFCFKHENLFSNIDHGINILNDEDIYWAYYREVIFYYLKLDNNVIRSAYLHNLLKKLKKNFSMYTKEYQYINNLSEYFFYECIKENNRKNECQKIIDKLEQNIDINKTIKNNLLYIKHFEYDGVLPFVSSGLLNINAEKVDENEHSFYITVTTSNNNKSLITLSCFLNCRGAIKSINLICKQPNVINTIFKLSFSMENCYYNIDYINRDQSSKEKIKDYFNKDTFLRFCEPFSEEYLEHFKNLLIPFDFINIENKLIKQY